MQGPCLQPGTGGSVEATQGSSYAEFAITQVECSNATYYYEAAGYSDPWPVVRYRIRLKRATSYYVPGYVALPVEARSPGHSPGHSPDHSPDHNPDHSPDHSPSIAGSLLHEGT